MTWRISFGNPNIVVCMIFDEVTLSSGQGTKRKDPAVDRYGVKSVHQEKNHAPGGGYLHPVEEPASWTYGMTGKHLMRLRCLVDNSYVRWSYLYIHYFQVQNPT